MPFTPGYTPWNKGKCPGQKRPLKLPEVEVIRNTLDGAGRLRELAMFNIAIDSKLRASDLVRLKIEDLFVGGKVVDRASVIQKKTGRPVQFEVGRRSRLSLENWIRLAGRTTGFVFPSKRNLDRALSTRQYARIVDSWVKLAGLEPHLYGTHSLRRTKATYLYRKTGNLRAVQLLLGHKSIENTIRYLGIDMDDALELANQVDL